MPAYGKIKINTLTYDSSGSAVDLAVSDIATDTDLGLKANKANPTFTGTINGAAAALTGDLTVDTNTLHVDATDNRVGIGLTTPQVPLHLDGANTRIQFTAPDTGSAAGDGVIIGLNGDEDFFINNRESGKNLSFFTVNSERLRIGSSGQIGIGGATYGTSGQVLTSQGASAAPQWADASSGALGYDLWCVDTNFGFWREWNSSQPLGSAQTFTDDGGNSGPGPATMSISRCTTSQNPLFAKVGTGMSMSAGVWTFPNTGEWRITFSPRSIENNSSHNSGHTLYLWTTSNNGTDWHEAYRAHNTSFKDWGEYVNYNPLIARVTITDTSNQKIRISMGGGDGRTKMLGRNDRVESFFMFEQIS